MNVTYLHEAQQAYLVAKFVLVGKEIHLEKTTTRPTTSTHLPESDRRRANLLLPVWPQLIKPLQVPLVERLEQLDQPLLVRALQPLQNSLAELPGKKSVLTSMHCCQSRRSLAPQS